MSCTDPLLLEVTRRVLREAADPQARGRSAADRRGAAWRALEDNGLTRAWIAESAGGSGASVADGFAIATLAGEFALDVPLAETLLAGWVLAAAGLAVPAGPIAPVVEAGIEFDDGGRLRGRAVAVPFAREAERLAVMGRRRGGAAFVALVDRAACAVEARDNLAGEPRDTVTVDGVAPVALAEAGGALGARAWSMGAVVRACQKAGALRAILGRSVVHAGERVAFDRPIGKFQAIQHALARLAGEAAIALAASGSAADALAETDGVADAGGDGEGVFLEVAAAKIRVGEAAAAGAAIAHQVHGAIGFSTEHALHLYTRRLWAWRDDFGSETVWAVQLGRRVAASGADALWPMVAAR